nr:MAG TPA: hypothetical protein [Caudoviricetes sp.]
MFLYGRFLSASYFCHKRIFYSIIMASPIITGVLKK